MLRYVLLDLLELDAVRANGSLLALLDEATDNRVGDLMHRLGHDSLSTVLMKTSPKGQQHVA